jgi:ATP-dependent exoDNAse (exonuclease V) beta subunit
VILPFVSWNLGHGRFPPTLWLRPANAPFNKLGLVPVKYRSDLQNSDFAEDYFNESYYALVDNVNMLYVSFTRAVDSLIGFCPSDSSSGSVSALLHQSLQQPAPAVKDKPVVSLVENFDKTKNIFTLGQMPDNKVDTTKDEDTRIESGGYYVNRGLNRVHLRFHGQNWIMKLDEPQKTMLNYGRIMHGIFESVKTLEDIPSAVNKKILEGIIPESDRNELVERINRAVSPPEISAWFRPGLTVMNEAEILTAGGAVKRPDRVIVDGDKVIIVDFKFGVEKKIYIEQVSNYRNLVLKMGYRSAEAFLWYVDNEKVVSV